MDNSPHPLRFQATPITPSPVLTALGMANRFQTVDGGFCRMKRLTLIRNPVSSQGLWIGPDKTGIDLNLNNTPDLIVLKLEAESNYLENNQKEHYMAFKTEYASKEDIEKYHLDELKKKYHLANPGLDWTYDKERDVFLMLSMNGRGDESNIKCFLLSWKSEIYHYSFSMSFEKETETIIWEMQLYGGEPQYKSEEERQKWEAIHTDLKEALRSYGLAGSVVTERYNARFSNF